MLFWIQALYWTDKSSACKAPRQEGRRTGPASSALTKCTRSHHAICASFVLHPQPEKSLSEASPKLAFGLCHTPLFFCSNVVLSRRRKKKDIIWLCLPPRLQPDFPERSAHSHAAFPAGAPARLGVISSSSGILIGPGLHFTYWATNKLLSPRARWQWVLRERKQRNKAEKAQGL